MKQTGGRLSACLAALAVTGSCLLLAASAADAQTIRGRVLDSATRDPIAMVHVSLLDERGRTVHSALTDAAGRFLLEPRAPGLHMVQADRLGYATLRTEPFEVPEEGDLVRDIDLVPRAIQLDEIVARGYPRQLFHDATMGGVYARRARSPSVGSNRVLVAGDPEMEQPVAVSDLLPPAVRPPSTWKDRAEWCGYLIVDGRDMEWLRDNGYYKANILSLHPSAFQAIEYYRDHTMVPMSIRPMEKPGDFGRLRRCGLLAVWTHGAPR